MMILCWILCLSSWAWADPSWRWSTATGILEKHEFYTNNEMIVTPKGSWQVLFAVMYRDQTLSVHKDCLMYKVPSTDPGHLKIKTIEASQRCEDFLFLPGDEEWKDLKALHYSIERGVLSVFLTHSQYRNEEWIIPLFNLYSRPVPKKLMSSAEFRSPKMIFLSPQKTPIPQLPLMKSKFERQTQCQKVSDQCEVESPSTCEKCPEGWYEVPNGCPVGPKYCGVLDCGQKNQPACRRGMAYQRVKKKFECRGDYSFAYCALGLSLYCEGAEAFCH